MSPAKDRTPEDTTRVSRKAAEPSLPRDKLVSLTVTGGPHIGKAFPLAKPWVSIGRSPANEVVIEDPDVSRVHCVLETRGTAGLLVDLGSSNGTFVDEQKITESRLENLSEFRVGRTTLMLIVRDQEE